MPFEPTNIDSEKKERFEKKTEDFSREKESMPERKIEVEKQIEVTKEKETKPESEKKPADKKDEQITEPAISPAIKPTAPTKSPTMQKIETILGEDLSDVFGKMDEAQKRTFKVEGEKTASKVELLLKSVKDKAQDILGLIRRWLKFIPGVNKFFLEQEAKIKTDKILKLKQKKEKEG